MEKSNSDQSIVKYHENHIKLTNSVLQSNSFEEFVKSIINSPINEANNKFDTKEEIKIPIDPCLKNSKVEANLKESIQSCGLLKDEEKFKTENNLDLTIEADEKEKLLKGSNEVTDKNSSSSDSGENDEILAEEKFELARNYYWGKNGYQKDKYRAFRLFKEAAKLGHVKAQSNLGLMYSCGVGCKRDYRKGSKWLTLAAVAGHKRAEHLLKNILFPCSVEDLNSLDIDLPPGILTIQNECSIF